MMTLSTSASLPAPLHDYIHHRNFWANPPEFDFWYAVNVEEWFWIHLRRTRTATFAISFFAADEGSIEVELYDLTHAPVGGLRATIVNTPLMTLQRYEPPLPVVALRLRNGSSQYFTLPRTAESLADQWLADVLQRLREALNSRWHLFHMEWEIERETLRPLWPTWAGPGPGP
ncbi:MAG: hypothetical protein H0T73_10255 [Ardenticatenales bacterium]|nr:hypothetical protein [Ardenticatenales bacterium]